MNYADPFAVQVTTPLSRALRKVSLQKSMVLNWPSGYLGPDYLASINQVAALAEGLSVTLPPADGANEGTAFFFNNPGQFAFDVRDAKNNLITSIPTGVTKYFYCENNSTAGGIWHVQMFGLGNSTADAYALAGLGVVAINGKLSAAHPVSASSSNFAITAGDRAKIFAATGGSSTATLPANDVVGNNFFFGAHNDGSGTMTLTPATGETIDGYPSFALAPNESVLVFCSGGIRWYTIGYGRSTQFQFTKLVKDISAGGTFVLTSAEASNKLLQFIGSITADTTVVIPSVVGIYYVQVTYTGASVLIIKTAAGSGVTLSSGDRAIIYCDGVNIVAAQSAVVGESLSIIDGTLNAPAIKFSADTNTGIYRADVDTVGLVGNGLEVARFGPTKSSVASAFGIGTAAPVAELHVNAGAAEAIRVQGTGATVTFYDTAGTGLFASIKAALGELRDTVTAGVRSFYIGAKKVLEIADSGITVNGAVTCTNLSGSNTGDQNLAPYALTASVANALASYARLSGGNVFAGAQTIQVQRSQVNPLGNVSGPQTLDLSLFNTFTMSIIGATSINFIGAPAAGYEQTMYLKIFNGGGFATSIVNTKFEGGVAPVMTANGNDLLAVWYDSQIGSYVVGLIFKDYK
jgi:hypothetical protein